MSKDCVPRSWILVFGREPEIRIVGAQKGLRRQVLLPMRGCGMQALPISNPFPSSLSSPLVFKDLGTGQQGEKWIACSGFSESAVAQSPAFGIGGLFHSVTSAYLWLSHSPSPSSCAPRVLYRGWGTAGTLRHRAGLRGFGSAGWRSWRCAEGAGAATWLGTPAEARGGNGGDGHVLQAVFSSLCQAIAFGLARVLPALAPSKC